jgi:hypothetical protein
VRLRDAVIAKSIANAILFAIEAALAWYTPRKVALGQARGLKNAEPDPDPPRPLRRGAMRRLTRMVASPRVAA